MEREDLYYVLQDQQKEFEEISGLIDRDITPSIIKLIPLRMPLIITGIRRCGKSSLLSILKTKLKVGKKEYIYVNFNDERLINFKTDDFQKIMDYLEENDYKKNTFFLLDEIQEATGWEKWVDRIRNKYPIILTGSNSKLLSKEISTILTGRSISINLLPFSFKEFLRYKKVDYEPWDLKIQSKIRHNLMKFLQEGGFPQKVITGKKVILPELYENILYRDIIKRFNKNMVKPIKEISLFLISNITSDISFRSLSKMAQVTNISTIKEIIHSFESAFVFFFVSKFDYSIRKQSQSPKKVYCIDNGFITTLGFKFSHNRGKLLENLVAVELNNMKKEFYYHKNEKKEECDFLIKDKLRISQAIQVCFELNEKNRQRELKGLLGAMNKFKIKEGLILTYDQKEDIKVGKKVIKVLPISEWLLKDP
ncbi:MAG: ATP-binding protein [Nanoarchaeota archaeon]|nr:ATP-binding protein [Nanoarchaeota archaeon]